MNSLRVAGAALIASLSFTASAQDTSKSGFSAEVEAFVLEAEAPARNAGTLVPAVNVPGDVAPLDALEDMRAGVRIILPSVLRNAVSPNRGPTANRLLKEYSKCPGGRCFQDKRTRM